MVDFMNIALLGAGIAAGYAINHYALGGLSNKITTQLQKLTKASSGSSAGAWSGWFLAMAVYGVLAFGGISLPHVKELGGVNKYAGHIVAGIGVGGLIDETLNYMPKI